jgi:glycine/D-amino acid oxidase-like deaminating enzyme
MSDVVIVGGGMVGIATARELAAAGATVTLLHDGPIGGGATAAAMGHLIALDDTDAIAAFTLHSLQRWRQFALPAECERVTCGCLWVAEDDEEMVEAHNKAARYRARNIAADVVAAGALRQLEPQLAPNLAGGLLVPADCVLYPPRAATWLLQQAVESGSVVRAAKVARVEPRRVHLADGSHLDTDWVVVATGDRAAQLLPALPVQPRKGHLLITARATAFVQHQVIELGYVKKAHGRDAESVACNVQPRVTGQVLVGSSRQLGTRDAAIERPILARMLQRATRFFPGLPQLTALRTWTGFRAATPDGAAIIGILEPGLAVATGHEGVGITQAPATAELMAHLILGVGTHIDATPFDPHRFEAVA